MTDKTKLLENNWMQYREGLDRCFVKLHYGTVCRPMDSDPVPSVALKWPMRAIAPCKAYSTQKAV